MHKCMCVCVFVCGRGSHEPFNRQNDLVHIRLFDVDTTWEESIARARGNLLTNLLFNIGGLIIGGTRYNAWICEGCAQQRAHREEV